MENRPIPKLYYRSVLIGIITFTLVVFVLPDQLNRHVPASSNIYVIDTVHHYIDTITVNTKPLNFKMKYSKSATAALAKHQDTFNYGNFLLNGNPKLLMWMMAHAIGLSLSYALFPFLLSFFSGLSASGNRKLTALIIAFIGILLLLGIINFTLSDLTFLPTDIMARTGVIFGNANWIMLVIVLLYLIPAWMALSANILLGIETIEHTGDRDIETIHELRRKYLFILRAASLILIFGIITSSLLQQSIHAAIGETYLSLFPTEFVIAYSLNFTFFLALFYGPVGYLVLQQNLIAESKVSQGTKKKFDIRMVEILVSTFAPMLTGIIVEMLK